MILLPLFSFAQHQESNERGSKYPAFSLYFYCLCPIPETNVFSSLPGFSFLSFPKPFPPSPLFPRSTPRLRQACLTPARLLVLDGPLVLDRDGVNAFGQLLGLFVHVLVKRRTFLVRLLLRKVASGAAAHGGSVSDVQEMQVRC